MRDQPQIVHRQLRGALLQALRVAHLLEAVGSGVQVRYQRDASPRAKGGHLRSRVAGAKRDRSLPRVLRLPSRGREGAQLTVPHDPGKVRPRLHDPQLLHQRWRRCRNPGGRRHLGHHQLGPLRLRGSQREIRFVARQVHDPSRAIELQREARVTRTQPRHRRRHEGLHDARRRAHPHHPFGGGLPPGSIPREPSMRRLHGLRRRKQELRGSLGHEPLAAAVEELRAQRSLEGGDSTAHGGGIDAQSSRCGAQTPQAKGGQEDAHVVPAGGLGCGTLQIYLRSLRICGFSCGHARDIVAA